MNRVKIALGIGIIFPVFCLEAANESFITRLQEKNIVKHQECIKQELKKTQCLRFLTYAAGAGLGAYSLKYLMTPPTPTPITPPTKKEMAEVIQKLREFIPILRKIAQKNKIPVRKPTWFGWAKDWFFYFFKEGVTGAIALYFLGNIRTLTAPIEKGVKTVGNTLGNTLDTIFQKPNMQWYINTHTQLKELFDELESTVISIEKKQLHCPVQSQNKTEDFLSDGAKSREETVDVCLTDAQWQQKQNEFYSSWKICVEQLEGVIAFLKIKHDLYVTRSLTVAKRFKEIETACVTTISEFCDKSEKYLNYIKNQKLPIGFHTAFLGFKKTLTSELRKTLLLENI